MTQLYLKQNESTIVYPYSPETLRIDYPQTSFPTVISSTLLNEYGVQEVTPSSAPEFDPLTEDLIELTPELINDSWIQQWSVITVSTQTAEERLSAKRSGMSCTPRQARIALQQVGLLNYVTAWIANADEITKIDWEFALEIRRDWPPITFCAIALGLSETNLDELFITAATL